MIKDQETEELIQLISKYKKENECREFVEHIEGMWNTKKINTDMALVLLRPLTIKDLDDDLCSDVLN